MNFDLPHSTILIQMCQPYVAGSDKLQYDHVVRKLASAIVQITLSSVKLSFSLSEGDCVHAQYSWFKLLFCIIIKSLCFLCFL